MFVVLLIHEPALRHKQFGVLAPHGPVAAEAVGREADDVALVNFDPAGQHVVLDRGFDVLGDGRVEAQGLVEDGLHVGELVHDRLVGVGVGALEDEVDLSDQVLHDPGVAHERVELPGELLCSGVASSDHEINEDFFETCLERLKKKAMKRGS